MIWLFYIALAFAVKQRWTSNECEENQNQKLVEDEDQNEQYQKLPQLDKLEEIYQSLQRPSFQIPRILNEEALTMRNELAEHTTNELK